MNILLPIFYVLLLFYTHCCYKYFSLKCFIASRIYCMYILLRFVYCSKRPQKIVGMGLVLEALSFPKSSTSFSSSGPREGNRISPLFFAFSSHQSLSGSPVPQDQSNSTLDRNPLSNKSRNNQGFLYRKLVGRLMLIRNSTRSQGVRETRFGGLKNTRMNINQT